MRRDLDWDGCINVRDLGGMAAADGHVTRPGAVVRSDNPAYLTAEGWSALRAFGIRTIVALRTEGTTDDEIDDRVLVPEVTIQRVLVEDGTDPDFVERCVLTGRFGSPLYFGDMLEHWPERCASAVGAIANAEPGGVVIACGRGCDRTGLVAFLLLGLVGVSAADIATDWAMSIDRLRPREPDYEPVLRELLQRERTTIEASIAQALEANDIEQRLIDGGLSYGELATVRHRILADAA